MNRPSRIGLALSAFVLLAPGMALARAGSSFSMGSRGGRTFSAPPPTSVAPFSAQPMQRSLAPRPEASPGFGTQPGYAQPSYGRPFAPMSGRSAFSSGLLGGLLGAGLGGLLFGRGLFGGLDGGGSIIGLLLQIGLIVLAVRWLLRRFGLASPSFAFGAAGGPGARGGNPGLPGRGAASPTPSQALSLSRADFQAFEGLLRDIQAAWSAHDTTLLQRLATPEMVGYFADQMADQASRGLRNTVSEVRLDRGDLSEGWTEGNRSFATVAMRFSMIDVTRDQSGCIVDGSERERVSVMELWTFVRVQGGRWLLSAIQQTR